MLILSVGEFNNSVSFILLIVSSLLVSGYSFEIVLFFFLNSLKLVILVSNYFGVKAALQNGNIPYIL